MAGSDRVTDRNDDYNENWGSSPTPDDQMDRAATDPISDAVEAIMNNLTPGDDGEP